MLPLLHPEDIDKDFFSGNQVFYIVFTSGHIANMCIKAGTINGIIA